MVINIESCEKAIFNKQTEVKNPNENIALLNFKQPIDYSQLDIPQEKEEIDENEERVFVDLSQQTEEKETDIMDLLLMEGEDDNDKK